MKYEPVVTNAVTNNEDGAVDTVEEFGIGVEVELHDPILKADVLAMLRAVERPSAAKLTCVQLVSPVVEFESPTPKNTGNSV